MFWLRALSAALLLVLGILSVFRVPHGVLWKPAVVATAFGVWCLPLVVVVALTGRDVVGALAAFAGLLLLSPIVRAAAGTRAIQAPVLSAFGDNPWTSSLAPPRRSAFDVLALPRSGAVGPEPESHLFSGQLALDLYRGAGPGPHPVVVAIHGGSWNKGDPSQLSAVYRYLAARGITVASTTYRLAPAYTFPAQLEDVEATLSWLRERREALDIDPDRTVLLGRSAGGHLALLTGYTTKDQGIRGVVALYPPTDMNWSWEHPTHPWIIDTPTTLSEFLGGPRDAIPDVYDAASPIRFVSPTSPPTLLVHGTRDELVFAEQSRRLSKVLDDHGVTNAVLETPWDTHGLEASLGGPGGQHYLWALERFLFAVLTDD